MYLNLKYKIKMSKDYYKILEIDEKSSEDDIKKSFKKLSLKYHPDRNPENKDECETKYKDIVEAYETLNDKTKKQQYDLSRSGGNQGNLFNILNNMFNINIQFNKPTKKFTQKLDIQLTLEDVYRGYNTVKKLKIETDCEDCLGLGKKEVTNCAICNGIGYKQVNSQIPFGFINKLLPCDICKQKGKIASGDNCERCEGKCKMNKILNIPISFPSGFFEDDFYRHIENDIEFLFIAKIQTHSFYTRKGNDLLLNKEINLVEALTGFEFHLKLLDDRTILVKSIENMIIHPNKKYTLKNLGINGADIEINFSIKFPESLNDNQCNSLKEILNMISAICYSSNIS
jgi:DnaJ-class molecular chaperone